MPYCTLDDLKKLASTEDLIQLSDLENTGAMDATVIAEAIETSDAQIDGYIANQVQEVPLSVVPTLINKLSAKMTIHELYSNRSITMIPETVNDWFKDCLRILKEIQSGKMHLNVSDTVKASGEYRINKDSDSIVFSKDRLDKF